MNTQPSEEWLTAEEAIRAAEETDRLRSAARTWAKQFAINRLNKGDDPAEGETT